MSGPNPPDEEPRGRHASKPVDEHQEELTDTGFHRAYSAPESGAVHPGPYVSADPALYDYDTYEPVRRRHRTGVGGRAAEVALGGRVTAIVAAIALVVSVSLLVTSTDSEKLATPPRRRSRPRRFRTRSPPRRRRPRRRPADDRGAAAPPPETVTVTSEPPPPPPPATTEAPPPVTTTPPPPPTTTTTTPAGAAPGHLFGDRHQGAPATSSP